MKILINIPAYNEEKTIEQVIQSIPRSIDDFEVSIQVVDDGSTDSTANIVRSMSWVTLLQHEYNQWVWAAFRTAVNWFLSSDTDILVNIDADGQFDTADIPRLVQPIIAHSADIVIGSRFSGESAKNMPWIKSILNRLIAWIVGTLMMKKIDDLTCWFRAYSRESLLRFNLLSSYTYTQETIIDAFGKDLRILWIPVIVRYFSERESRVVKTITSYMFRSAMIILRTVRDVKPLVFFGVPGIFVFLFWIILFFVFLYFYLQTFQTTPYRTWLIVSGVSILTWLLLFVFALIADMIKRNTKVNEEILYLTKKQMYQKNK